MSVATTVQTFQSRVRRAAAELRGDVPSVKCTAIPKLLQIVELLKLQQSVQQSAQARKAPAGSNRTLRSRNRPRKNIKATFVAGLSPFDYRRRQKYLMRKYCDIWSTFFESELYCNWRAGRPWQLCCYGEPGCGKSTLASAIVDNINRWYSNGDAITIVMFLDEKDINGRRLWQVAGHGLIKNFRSNILRQLIEIQGEKGLVSIYEQSTESGAIAQVESLRDPALALDRELARMRDGKADSKLFMIVDGLDQCPDNVQDIILEEITRLRAHYVTTRQQPLSAPEERFCDSCDMQDIKLFFQCRQCELDTIDVCQSCHEQGTLCQTHGLPFEEIYTDRGFGLRSLDDEIGRYIRWEIERELLATPLGRELARTADIMQRVERAIQTKAGGALVIARVFIEYLIREQTLHELFDTLAHVSLPEAAYFAKIMDRVLEQEPTDRKIGLTILWMVSKAYIEVHRAITYDELVAACSMIEDPEIMIASEHHLLRVCRSLVGMSRIERDITPFHDSLAIYIYEECAEIFTDTKIDLAEICLKCILGPSLNFSMGAKDREGVQENFSNNAFLTYAVRNWGFHLAANSTLTAITMAMELFTDDKKFALYLLHASFAQASTSTAGTALYLWPGCQPMHVCAYFGLTDVFRLLSEREPMLDVNLADPIYGRTPLVIACTQGHADFARELLRHDADLTKECARGRTALEEAMERDDFDLFLLLMSDSTSVISEQLQTRVAIAAAKNACPLFLQHLVETIKIDINRSDDDGTTLLAHAIASGHQKNLKCLLQQQSADLANVNHRGETAFHAAANTDTQTLRNVLDAAKSHCQLDHIDAQDSAFGKTATMLVIQNEQMEVVDALQLLVKAGADLRIVDSRERGLVHYAAAYQIEETCLRWLHHENLTMNQQDADGWTPLHVACCAQNLAAVTALIDLGVDLDIRDKQGRIPLVIARLYDASDVSGIASLLASHTDTTVSTVPSKLAWSLARADSLTDDTQLSLLSSENAKATDPFMENTLLHWAAQRNDLEQATEIIMDGRIDINARNRDGHTALSLHCARYDGPDADMVRLLLQHGAKQDLPADIERRPYTLASQRGFWDSALSLFEHDDTNPRMLIHLEQLLGSAIQDSRRSSIEQLLDVDRNVLLPVDGMLPTEYAKSYGAEEDILDLLAEKEAAVLQGCWPIGN